ncbi:MAG: hypothetical protein HY690_06760 [Chloroflexi bacterium]|nr:hypothetical protein [Chloroflexota bacterium]
MSQESSGPCFTCKECGAHELVVTHTYAVVAPYTASAPCTCGQASDGVAVERVYHLTIPYHEWGLLDERHQWTYEESEEVAGAQKQEDRSQVFCSGCLEGIPADAWETSAGAPRVSDDSHEFYVHCDGCEREIEFGWSYPERGGRIWPVECTDFNPSACWPEPRYREVWARRDWLPRRPCRKEGDSLR